MAGMAETLEVGAIEEHDLVPSVPHDVVDVSAWGHASYLRAVLAERLLTEHERAKALPSRSAIPSTDVEVAALVFIGNRMVRAPAHAHKLRAPWLRAWT